MLAEIWRAPRLFATPCRASDRLVAKSPGKGPTIDRSRFSDAALPIDVVLGDVRDGLARVPRAVLVAPPGAGKTTRVPLALLDEPWTGDGRLIVLEPRRIAARAAAERMAATRGEAVGDTIGLRARFDTRVSGRTRIEVVTEGVFTRMILDDPALDGVAGVIFDEFHERSLDADLGLALSLETQAVLRPDLRILVMSATLDGARVAAILDDAPLIRSDGRAFPIVTHYVGRDPGRRLEDDVGAAILRAVRSEAGSILAFLPGQGEITRVAALLDGRLGPDVVVAPLFGAMDRGAQDRAIAPAPPGHRKIVLATAIAETSLTIEGVRVVIDSGMARVPRFEPDLGLTRLETVRVSRAGAEQRRGRAGRTEPGVCYRLWDEAGTGALQPFARPEILDADLSGLLLDLAIWGTRDPNSLRWLDPPPVAALAAARAVLRDLQAIDADGGITAAGRAMASLGLPPRLARMVVTAAERGAAQRGAELATLLVERGLGGTGTDAGERLERWHKDRSSRAEAARGLARSVARRAVALVGTVPPEPVGPGHLLALAFPDRIAKQRGRPGEFLLANGRAAAVEPHDPLARAPFLAVGEITGRAAATRILLATPLELGEIERVTPLASQDEWSFDRAQGRIGLRRVTRLGAIAISEHVLAVPAGADAAERLAEGIASLGIDRLPWTKALQHWRGRVAFLRTAEGDAWPDLSDTALAAAAPSWLAPYLTGKTSLAEVDGNDLREALHALVPYESVRRLEQVAPAAFTAPTGSQLPVDYADPAGPSIAVRVQELFGLAAHPTLADGRVRLTLHLLSPAHRPIQITRDLPGFWKGSWSSVKAEMRGRYPRHPWPDDPASARPTTRAKPRGT